MGVLGAAGLVVSVPWLTPKKWMEENAKPPEYKFHRSCIVGNSVAVKGPLDKAMLAVWPVIREDTKRCLPPGTMYEIRAKIPVEFGRISAIAWISNPGIRLKITTESFTKFKHVAAGDYLYGGRWRT